MINFEIVLDLNWLGSYIIVANNNANQGAKFSITDAEPYVPVLTLSTQIIQNLVSKEQLTGVDNNEKYQHKEK